MVTRNNSTKQCKHPSPPARYNSGPVAIEFFGFVENARPRLKVRQFFFRSFGSRKLPFHAIPPSFNTIFSRYTYTIAVCFFCYCCRVRPVHEINCKIKYSKARGKNKPTASNQWVFVLTNSVRRHGSPMDPERERQRILTPTKIVMVTHHKSSHNIQSGVYDFPSQYTIRTAHYTRIYLTASRTFALFCLKASHTTHPFWWGCWCGALVLVSAIQTYKHRRVVSDHHLCKAKRFFFVRCCLSILGTWTSNRINSVFNWNRKSWK